MTRAAASSPHNDNINPYFVDLIENETVQNSVEVPESTTGKPVAKKEEKATTKKPAAAHGKQGPLSPLVLTLNNTIGDSELNKLRGKVIGLHSDVIGSFVETADSPFGQTVLKSLFSAADKNHDGKIDESELETALRVLGFDFLKSKQVQGILGRADANQDGRIDMEEWMREAPKTLRTNLIKLAKKNGGELGLLV
jgi:hypothetical protein